MRIGIISDVHKDHNELWTGEDITALYIIELKKRTIDVLIVAGDVAEELLEVKSFINDLREALGIVVLYIPGNHEMWDGKRQSTELRYMDFATQIEGSLCGKPYHLNDEWVVVGDLGWYDYGFKLPFVTEQIVQRKKKKIWAEEYRQINIQKTDQQFAKEMVERVEDQIKLLQDKKIIFVNHFVLFEKFLSFKKENNDWNFANAYMGSKSMGDMILKYPNIKMAIFGHTHRRFGLCEYKNIKVVCNPLGYKDEWAVNNIVKEIERSIVEVNLEDMK